MIVYNELQIHYYAHPVLGDESRAVTIFIHVQTLKHPGAHRRGLNRESWRGTPTVTMIVLPGFLMWQKMGLHSKQHNDLLALDNRNIRVTIVSASILLFEQIYPAGVDERSIFLGSMKIR